jgi:hypothetical protein
MVVVASEKPDPEDKQDGLTRDTDKPAFDPGFRRERAMPLASRVHGRGSTPLPFAPSAISEISLSISLMACQGVEPLGKLL